jgi:hypothetical protein
MITGKIKSKVDRIWDTLWSGGISNPLTIIEQLTYLTDAVMQLPSIKEQQRFTAIVESIERQKTTQRAHLAELATLFDALQHRAFRGEL